VIADLYEECTVFFADIAGFTKWSSTREPVSVFSLLQALFAAMDKVAKKYKIFKVETIGDCYVAVTGLPNRQDNHAELMARFATECMKQMKKTTLYLASTLGDDTVELLLRIGLHSGPVTAGILRGEKSRFQLFGDTVNTASRMESTGEKNRIQVSSTTAEILIASGKGHWLNQREDLVEAKGKGTLQTYWLSFRNNRPAERRHRSLALVLTVPPGKKQNQKVQKRDVWIDLQSPR
jgi:class 3 adenylate cyclase